jgi:hypothetical protein
MYYTHNGSDIICDVPPLRKGWSVVTRIITGVITEVMTHNTSHTRIKYMKCSKK